MELAPERARAAALLITGTLIFCDVAVVAWAGFYATIAMLVAIGFVEHRLRAVAWAVILVASALLADVLWQLDWEPFNRSEDYEPIPQTPFVLLALPIPMILIAVGVGAGTLWRRIRSQPHAS